MFAEDSTHSQQDSTREAHTPTQVPTLSVPRPKPVSNHCYSTVLSTYTSLGWLGEGGVNAQGPCSYHPVLVSSIYTVDNCPISAEGGEKCLGLGAAHLRRCRRFWPVLAQNWGKCRRSGGGGLGA